ncbi:MAG: hypothetical protein WAT88_17520 [Saprospiraceae bacterium]
MIPEFYHKIVPTAIPEDYKIVVFQKSIFPEISTGLAESYCVEKNCDCRHVFISVILKRESPELISVISYGWESTKFYAKWMHTSKNDDSVKQFKGPTIFMSYSKDALSSEINRYIVNFLGSNKEYQDHIKRHYKAVKDIIGKR